MKYILTFLLISSFILVVFTISYEDGKILYNYIDPFEILEWFKSEFDSAPRVFYDWGEAEGSFAQAYFGDIVDFFMLLIYPIRLVLWIVPLLFSFISKFFIPQFSWR